MKNDNAHNIDEGIPAQKDEPDFGEIYACLMQGDGLSSEDRMKLMHYTDLFPDLDVDELERSLRHIDIEIKKVSHISDGYVSPSPYNPFKKEYEKSLADYYCTKNLYLDSMADFASSPLSMESVSLQVQRDKLESRQDGGRNFLKRLSAPLRKRKLDVINRRLEAVEKECQAEEKKLARLKNQCEKARKAWDESKARMSGWEKENSRNRMLIRLYETKTDLRNIMEYKTRHQASFSLLSEDEMYRLARMFQNSESLGSSFRNVIRLTEDTNGRYSSCVQEQKLPYRNSSDKSSKWARMNDFDNIFNSMFGMHDYRRALETYEKSSLCIPAIQEERKQGATERTRLESSCTISR